jgi:hypothetical protein
MNLPKKCIAIDALLLTAALWAGAATAASPAATVTQVSGPLFAQGTGGRIKVLSMNSAVAPGDTLITGNETYAQVTFADRGVVTLAPDTQVAIDAFSFDEARPAADRAELSLIEGTMRVESGAIAKRNPARQGLKTPAGAIDGAGATFIVRYSPGAAPPPQKVAAVSTLSTTGTLSDAPIMLAQLAIPQSQQSLPPGLYVQVLDGLIHVANPAGTQSFSAGQFGFTPSFRLPPVIVPNNPGIQFTPPPAFSSPPSTNTSTSSSGKSNTVDCEVR